VRHAPHAGACEGRHRAEIDPPRQKCKAGHQAQVFRAQPIGTTAQEPSRRASRQRLQPRLPGAGSRPPGPRPPCHVIGAPDITSDDLDAAALQTPGHNRGGYGSHIEAPTVAPGAFRALTNASTGSLLVIRTRLLDVVWSLELQRLHLDHGHRRRVARVRQDAPEARGQRFPCCASTPDCDGSHLGSGRNAP
jgi:hypothetical protein